MSPSITQDEFLCQVAEEAAQRGFDLLEERWPGFYLAMDTAKLDLCSEKACVLGQLSSWTPIPKWALEGSSLDEVLSDLDADGEIGSDGSEFKTYASAKTEMSKLVCVANWDVARNFLGLTMCEAAHYGFLDVVAPHTPCACGGQYPRQLQQNHIQVGYTRVECAWARLIEEAQAHAMRRELIDA